MPIKGLSESRRLPRLGKVRLGVKATSQKGNEYPVPVDHFVLPPELVELYGEKVTELPIRFLTNEWPPQYWKAYSKTRGLICKGDGERATALVDSETGEIATAESKKTEMKEVPCDPERCDLAQRGQCHRLMSLQFFVEGTKRLGVYQLDTGSINSIINVNSSLDMVQVLSGGRIAMIPMKLRLVEAEVAPEGRKKKVWVLMLDANIEDINRATLRPLTELPQLPSPDSAGAPDDIYPQDVIDDKIHAQAEQGHNEPRQQDEPQKDAQPEEKKHRAAPKPKEEPKQSAAPGPFVPPDGNATDDAAKALCKELEELCASVDDSFEKEVVLPRIKIDYRAESLKALKLDQLQRVKDWLTGKAEQNSTQIFVLDLRKQHRMSDEDIRCALRDIAGKETGPYTNIDLLKVRRTVARRPKKQEAKPEPKAAEERAVEPATQDPLSLFED